MAFAMNPRRMGIPGTGTARWGEHLCAFYYTEADLLDLVVPYIKAGLEDNEFCLWITRDSTEQQALQALERVLPNAEQYLGQNQLEVIPCREWYLSSGVFDEQQSFDRWASRARTAEMNGFIGVRTTGNPFWLDTEDDWMQFLRYEHTVHQAIETQRVISLCTYPVRICSAKNMLGTFASHHAMLLSHGNQWQCMDLRHREAAV